MAGGMQVPVLSLLAVCLKSCLGHYRAIFGILFHEESLKSPSECCQSDAKIKVLKGLSCLPLCIWMMADGKIYNLLLSINHL